MATASAPGKVHLVGEHAVVYGEPTILAAVGLRTYCEAKKSEYVRIISKSRGTDERFPLSEVMGETNRMLRLWGLCAKKGDFSGVIKEMKRDSTRFKKVAVGLSLKMMGIEDGVTIKVWGDVPIGAGLGSSASLAAAIAKSISLEFGAGADVEKINEIAYECEKLSHGRPSGGDNSACCYGGLIWFQKEEPNVIMSLKEEVPYKLENFCLVYTTKPLKTTGELVQLVGNLPENVRGPKVKDIGLCTRAMLEALKARDFDSVKVLINRAQDNLAGLGVSVDEIDEVVAKVRSIGGAAKGCGAMGGGIVLCYHENRDKLVETLRGMKLEPLEADLGVEGVRME